MDAIIFEAENYVKELESDFDEIGINTGEMLEFDELQDLISSLKHSSKENIRENRKILENYSKIITALVSKKVFIEGVDTRFKEIIDNFAKMGYKPSMMLMIADLKQNINEIKNTGLFSTDPDDYKIISNIIKDYLSYLEKLTSLLGKTNKRIDDLKRRFELLKIDISTQPEYKLVQENMSLLNDIVYSFTNHDLSLNDTINSYLDTLEIKVVSYQEPLKYLIELNRNKDGKENAEKFDIAYDSIAQVLNANHELNMGLISEREYMGKIKLISDNYELRINQSGSIQNLWDFIKTENQKAHETIMVKDYIHGDDSKKQSK